MKLTSKKVKFLLFGSFILLLLVIWPLNTYAKSVHVVFVKYSEMEVLAPHMYVEPTIDSDTRSELQGYLNTSKANITKIFGSRQSSPDTIFISSKHAQKKYSENPTGQTYYFYWNSYIVIGPKGFNVNIISHEITHAELRYRLHNKDSLPVWFDEGLATMADGRFTGNEIVWMKKTNNGEKEVDYRLLDSNKAFEYGSAEAWNNYNLACYEVTRWYKVVGKEGLLELIKVLNGGEDFTSNYRRIENDANLS